VSAQAGCSNHLQHNLPPFVFGKWQEHEDARGKVYFTNKLDNGSGGILTLGAAQANDMGVTATAEVSGRLSTLLNPKYLAMSGICAGLRSDSNLGDVIVTNIFSTMRKGRTRPGKMRKEMLNRYLHLKPQPFRFTINGGKKIERMTSTWQPSEALRPKSILSQARWVPDQLRLGEDVLHHPDFDDLVPRWEETLNFMRKKERWGKAKGLALSKKGQTEADEMVIIHPKGPPKDPPFKRIHAPLPADLRSSLILGFYPIEF